MRHPTDMDASSQTPLFHPETTAECLGDFHYLSENHFGVSLSIYSGIISGRLNPRCWCSLCQGDECNLGCQNCVDWHRESRRLVQEQSIFEPLPGELPPLPAGTPPLLPTLPPLPPASSLLLSGSPSARVIPKTLRSSHLRPQATAGTNHY